jgi:hypothetical protein
MDKLYVLGGRQRRPGLRETTYENEWCLYEAALILEVDTNSGVVRTCVEYQSPLEVLPGNRPGAHFHSGALVGNMLYTCTTTEVLIYSVPEFKQIGYISLPCFNDLHHVTPSSDGNLLVVSTGLDMVVKITPRGEIVGEWSVLDETLWVRFSQSIDYRKENTKPHVSHPNFAFELDNEVWTTRYYQRDAISLNGSKRRIEFGGEGNHDGFLYGEWILFTAVDGKVVIVNRRNLQTEQIIDLRQIQDLRRRQDGGQPMVPAWCRGLLPVDERRIWVGFTRMRKTIFRENIRWVKNILGHTVKRPTHIALFDIVEKQCLKELDLEPYGLHTVFGIFPALA